MSPCLKKFNVVPKYPKPWFKILCSNKKRECFSFSRAQFVKSYFEMDQRWLYTIENSIVFHLVWLDTKYINHFIFK